MDTARPAPAPAPVFRARAPRAIWEADSPAAAAAAARRDGATGPIAVEWRRPGTGAGWAPAVVFAAGLSAADFDAIADDAR